MTLALSLGRRGLGRTWPNPAVGCVIVQQGHVVGRGWTQPGGRPHAETEALAQAGSAARGADVYVTLEPCSHVGKTPPCAQALIDAGYDPPYSCMSGTCCTCMAQKVEGDVRMVRNDALSKSEVKKDFILTCQSKILTDTVKVNYDLD